MPWVDRERMILGSIAFGVTYTLIAVRRLPSLRALATATNTGGVAALVGNPQIMLGAGLGGLRFASFAFPMLPVASLGLAANHAILPLLFRRELAGDLPAETVTEPLLTV